MVTRVSGKLKLIDRLRATRWTFPDYWQTDNSNGLVMVIRNYHWLNSASRVLISTCSTPLVQMGDCKQFSPFNLDHNPRLTKVKVDPHSKNQGQRSNGSNRWAPTDKQTDTHTYATKRIISPCYGIDNYDYDVSELYRQARRMWQHRTWRRLRSPCDTKHRCDYSHCSDDEACRRSLSNLYSASTD